MSATRLLGLTMVSAWLLAGCSSPKKIEVGGTCILNSDCNSPLLCTDGKCHDACHASVDCPTGQYCVKTNDSTFCQLPAEADCSRTTCSSAYVCASDLRCRTPCQSAPECANGQVCVTNVCADPIELVTGTDHLPQKGPSLAADGGTDAQATATGGAGGGGGPGGASGASGGAGDAAAAGSGGTTDAAAAGSGGTKDAASGPGGAGGSSGGATAGAGGTATPDARSSDVPADRPADAAVSGGGAAGGGTATGGRSVGSTMGLGGSSGDAGGIADGGTPTDGATATPVVCNTTIPGGSLAAANWTLAGSPYCIEGTVRVSLLTVEPGVEIFVDGAFAIEILTSMTAIGTEASPIRFSARSPAAPDNQRWKGLKFADVPPGSHLSYAIVEYANASGLTLSNSAALATLDHCTFHYNSTATSGGAINATGALSNLTLTNCTFSQNSATTSGGAISAAGGSSLTLTNCTFSQNSATTNGGAISATDVPSNLTLTNCTFSQNSASMNGGALSIAMAKGLALTLARSLFDSNTANPTHAAGNCMGGALYSSAGDIVISDCEFRGNRVNSQCTSDSSCTVAARGGAIWLGGTSAAVTRSLFVNNQTDALYRSFCFSNSFALSQGAGLYLNAGTVTSKSNIWACNTTTASACNPTLAGAGIYVGGGAVNVTNDTIARNSSTGVDRAAGTLAVRNSILYANNSNGAQVGGTGTTPDGGVPFVTIAYSDVHGGYTGDGNTGFNPAFSGASCESSDLALLAGSPAIDTGDPDSALNDGCTPPGLGTARNDMGAFGGPANCGWQ